MKDIHELIRQREIETVRLEKEIERIHKELDALRLTAKLLDESTESAHSVVPAAAPIARETTTYNAASAARTAATPAATPSTWASAKQFP